MPQTLTAGYLEEVLKANNLRPNHRLGQNFLVSPHIFSELIRNADVRHTEVILEIGAGIGRLTALLADRARQVVAVERDAGLFRVASERLAGRENVSLIHEDFLESKHKINRRVAEQVTRVKEDSPLKVVANLPYQISSPAIINLLQWPQPVSAICVMVQKEVAERLIAGPSAPRQYGPLSVFAAYRSDTQLLFQVPPSAFRPQPEVSSAVVELKRRPPGIEAIDYNLFAQLVNILFQNRRKMLRKALKIGWGEPAAQVTLGKTGIDGRLRAEQLEVEEFVVIANTLLEVTCK